MALSEPRSLDDLLRNIDVICSETGRSRQQLTRAVLGFMAGRELPADLTAEGTNYFATIVMIAGALNQQLDALGPEWMWRVQVHDVTSGLEDLDVLGMLPKESLSSALSDMARCVASNQAYDRPVTDDPRIAEIFDTLHALVRFSHQGNPPGALVALATSCEALSAGEQTIENVMELLLEGTLRTL